MKRTYLLHLPPSTVMLSPAPLIISFHGMSGTCLTNQSVTGFSPMSDSIGFIVAYPNGTGNPTTWNAGSCCNPASSNNVNDVQFVSMIIDTLSKLYPIDSTRICAAGFSNGAMFVYRLAAELSSKIAAIAPVSGTMTVSQCNPERPVPIIHIHAIDDGSVLFAGSSYFLPVDTVLSIWSRINGCNLIPDTIFNSGGVLGKKWNAQSSGADVILYRSNTGGHSWSMGGAVQTSNLIWEFFASHPMRSSGTVSISNYSNPISDFALDQNYPNPFNPSTVICFQSSVDSYVTLIVYDILGREVQKLVNERKSAGSYSVTFDASNLPSGVYWYRLSAPNYVDTKKLILLK
jgi:polyhydroxybutyrate depolymerase